MPGGVAEDWFQLERKAPAPGDAAILLTVARLDENKGHDMVIRALPAIRQRNPKVRYVMIGPRPENWPRLERLAEEFGVLDIVEYRGTVSDEALREAYSRAKVFIMASREIPGQLVEGFGLTFLEAAAAGLPSVAGNSGGIPDAVEHEVSGLLVDPASPDDIAKAVCRILENPLFAQQLASQGRTRALNGFTWSIIARQMAQAMEQALEARKRLQPGAQDNLLTGQRISLCLSGDSSD